MVAAAFAAEGYKVISKIKIGGNGGWDYVAMDSANRRLYVSHGTSVEVVDPDAGKVVGTISELHGVHGIAIATDLNKGFITNGQSNSVTIFDLKTLAKIGEPAAGKNPDAVCYEPKTKRIFTFNHPAATPPPSTPRPTKSSRPSRWAQPPSSAWPMAPASSTSTSRTRTKSSRSMPPRTT